MTDHWKPLALSDVLDVCTKCGVAVNLGCISEKEGALREELVLLRQDIMEICGEEFDLEDQWQLGIVLFEKLGLEPVYRCESGYRVDREHLMEVAHPVVQRILDHRSAITYLRCISEYEHTVRNGRVHPTFTITEIGRIVTSNPNVQSTPQAIRSIMVADPRYTFVEADWRAMHLRLLANLSQDPELMGLFADGRDPFVDLAAMLFGHDVREVTSAERSTAKAITYALLYGGRCPSLARRHRLATDVVQEYWGAFLRRFRGVDRWIRKTVKAARADKVISTITGRHLSSVGVNRESIDGGTIINRILQGSEADLLAEAITGLDLSFRDGGNIISFPIHDEILVQSRAGWIGNAIELLTDHMTSVGHDLVVPMAVKVMVGPNWGDLHEPTANEACA